VGLKDDLVRLLNRIEKKLDNDDQSRETAEKHNPVARSGKSNQLTIFLRSYYICQMPTSLQKVVY